MPKIDMSRLVLGTAQLGMSYGIANQAGQPDQKIADEIVAASWQSGGREFDTAQAYGESETVLGNSLRNLDLENKAKIISKPHPQLDLLHPGSMGKAIRKSLDNLGIEKFYGYMIHKEDFLPMWDKGIEEQTKEIREQGLADKIGISVYSPEMAVHAVETDGIDLIQLPSNLFDRRFEDSGAFEKAIESGKTIYVRSVFLQGLMFMDSTNLPEHMKFATPFIERLNALVKTYGLSIQHLALGYAAKAYPQAKILVGAELPEQMLENIESFSCNLPDSLIEEVKTIFNNVPEKLVNPVLWK
ncbi:MULTISPECIES: aldo/keto reductase [unclassified Maridesulfovibrio]|uniref:aldo/keto reductase n=1 Tax=unclassified Maridesulfovibrio TaxID=2794999 RepID=UPI003B3BEC0D